MTNANAFIATREVYGRTESYVEVDKLAQALATAWGAKVGKCEAGHYGIGCVELPNGLVVTIRTDTRKVGQIEADAGAPSLIHQTGALYGVEWPKASANVSKGLDKLAADLKRRVVDPATEPLAKAAEKLAGLQADRASLRSSVEALKAAIPAARVKVSNDLTNRDASVSITAPGGAYISGRLTPSGGFTLDRMPTIRADKVLDVLAALCAA